MVAFILAGDLRCYTVKSIEHRPKTRIVLFEFVSIDDKPDIHMDMKYIKLADGGDNVYMISSVRCMNGVMMLSGVAEKELEKFGKKVTQDLHNFYRERKTKHAKEDTN